ncbi:MAG: hypothetical protein ACOYMA_09440 [Bacteroidia bacterium]
MKNKIFIGLITIGLSMAVMTSCNNSDKNNKTTEKELELQKRELELKAKELEIKEKELNGVSKTSPLTVDKEMSDASNKISNDGRIVKRKCSGSNQIYGKLLSVQSSMCGLQLQIQTNKGEEWINFDNYDVKVDDQRLFKWSNNKIKNFVENDDNFDLPFPTSAIDVAFINKKYTFCCKKGPMLCGDDPNAKTDYCTQIYTP